MSEEKIRVKHYSSVDVAEMTTYQKLRVLLGFIHIVATLGAPFVIILLNEYLRSN